jgi:hypothetical protein
MFSPHAFIDRFIFESRAIEETHFVFLARQLDFDGVVKFLQLVNAVLPEFEASWRFSLILDYFKDLSQGH